MNQIPLQKALLSLVVIVGFSAYSIFARANDALQATQTVASTDRPSIVAAAPPNPPAPVAISEPVSVSARSGGGDEDSYENDDGGYVSLPQPKTPPPAPKPTPTPPPPTPAPTPKPQGQYRDGSYTGPSVDVFYGNVQVEAIVSGGKLTDVRFLDYPQDRRTSVMINTQAMPYLTQEAVQAQSASVDGVSGATATSEGFVRSLGNALSQAHV